MKPAIGEFFTPYHYSKRMGPIVIIPANMLELVSHKAFILYGILRNYAGPDGNCYPKIETLAHDLRRGVTATKEALAELVAKNFIAIRTGYGRSNRYFFLWHPCFEEAKVKAEESDSRPHTEEESEIRPRNSRISGLSGAGSPTTERSECRLRKGGFKKKIIKEKEKGTLCLEAEQQEWIDKNLALTVFNLNLEQEEAQLRKAELFQKVKASAPVDLLLPPVRQHCLVIESRINRLSSDSLRTTGINKFRSGTLKKRDLEEYLEVVDEQAGRKRMGL